jgi:aminopeptidase N
MNTYASDEEFRKTEFALEVGVDMLRGFENYFEIPFVLSKLGSYNFYIILCK